MAIKLAYNDATSGAQSDEYPAGARIARTSCHLQRSATSRSDAPVIPQWDGCIGEGLGKPILGHRNPQSPPNARFGTAHEYQRMGTGALALSDFPFVTDRSSVADAHELMARFGDDAGFEAAVRADANRSRGNVPNFCRWRQIERMIIVLALDEVSGTVH